MTEKNPATNVSVRLVRCTTPHGVFVGYQLLEVDEDTGEIVDLQPIPLHFEDAGEAYGLAHSIMQASKMPIVDVESRFVVIH